MMCRSSRDNFLFSSLPLFLIVLFSGVSKAFISTESNLRHRHELLSTTVLKVSASELLYQDQQQAMLRRATDEEGLLSEKKQPQELVAPKLKAAPPKAGTGFANNASMDVSARLAAEQAKVMKRDGVLRINNVLSPETSDKLRQYLLDQQKAAEEATEKDPRASKLYYGVEQSRKNRCDMHLSLTRGGIQASSEDTNEQNGGEHVVADALQEILGSNGTLRPAYEALVSNEGEFYELAGIITNPGSFRQMIHPDLPFQKTAPLYVVFLGLQDVTEEMGPTSFLVKTHTEKAIKIFESGDMEKKDDQLRKADCRLALLKKGDAVLFDARVLHAGGANDIDKGATRVMLNFSFRNPKVKDNLGYKGSIMPGYVGAMNLGDVGEALKQYADGQQDPFAQYGNGIEAPR